MAKINFFNLYFSYSDSMGEFEGFDTVNKVQL